MEGNETRNISELRPTDGFNCEKCGIDLRDWNRIQFDDDEEFVHVYVFRYCPNCGRKVIKGESEDGKQ